DYESHAVPAQAHLDVAAAWNDVIARFLSGGPRLPPDIRRWRDESYLGHGLGAVELDALPEPYAGSLFGEPRAVFLALNPGRADLTFQSRNGIFANEIRRLGTYSAWTATWPYQRNPWLAHKGPNRHGLSRLAFMRRWHNDGDLAIARMLT